MPTRIGSAHGKGDDDQDNKIILARELAEKARAKLDGQLPKLCIVLAAPQFARSEILREIIRVGADVPLIGCTTAGEFTESGIESDSLIIIFIASDNMRIQLFCPTASDDNPIASIPQIRESFIGLNPRKSPSDLLGRTMMLITDGLSGMTESIMDELMTVTGMQYQLFGAAAADQGRFSRTDFFYNDEVRSHGFVCAEILSETPFGIGFRHGWQPCSPKMRVTRSDNCILSELNGRIAWPIYEELATQELTQQELARQELAQQNFSPLSHLDPARQLFSKRILGIVSPSGTRLRVPVSKLNDGSIRLAAPVAEGSIIQLMGANTAAIVESGAHAISLARARLGNQEPAGALVFECFATRIALGDDFSLEVQGMAKQLNDRPLAGCNSYGQMARIRGEFAGLMDATALVCLVPQ